ncbi:Proteinase inhibitor I25, cystatin, conserved region, partial [Trema orientale]
MELARVAIYLLNKKEGTNLVFNKVVSASRVRFAYTLSIQASDNRLYEAKLVVPRYNDKENDLK